MLNLAQWIEDVNAGKNPGFALVITGPQGRGKTTLTSFIQKRVVTSSSSPVVFDDFRIDMDQIKNLVTDPEFCTGVIVETNLLPDQIGLHPSDRRFLTIQVGV